MLQIQNLTLIHKDDLRTLVEDLSITVNEGDKLAIIGEEGNGKSAILKFIRGDSEIHEYLDVSGHLHSRFQRMAYLPQSLSENQLDLSLQEFMEERLDFNHLDYNLLYQISQQLGFDGDRVFSRQLIGSLSGGERIKLQLLRLLMVEPDLILLDEPSNDLDIASLQWLENFIKQSPLTIIFVSHDVTLLSNTAKSILHIEQLIHKTQPKHTYARLPYQAYVAERNVNYQHQRQAALKQREDDAKKMERHRQLENKLAHQLNITKDSSAGRLLAKKMKNIKATGKRYERERNNFLEIPIREDPIDIHFNDVVALPASKRILSLENYELKVAGRILAKNINLSLFAQDKIGMVGANGVGKSTLLKQIVDMLGEWQNFNPGYMPQIYEDSLVLGQSPVEYLTGVGSQEERSQIMTYLGSMRYLPEEMNRPIANLSGGQKAKLLLMKLDFHKNNFLFLDEPTRNFSPSSQPEIIETLKKYPGGILTISHDRGFLEEVCQVIYELTEDGLKEWE